SEGGAHTTGGCRRRRLAGQRSAATSATLRSLEVVEVLRLRAVPVTVGDVGCEDRADHPGGNLVRVWARLSPQPGLRAAEGLEVLEEEEQGLGVVLGHDDVVVGRLAGVRSADQLANKLEHELVRARASRLGGLDTEGVVALRDGGEGRVGLVDERAPVDALS